jgi:hypothetical protein
MNWIGHICGTATLKNAFSCYIFIFFVIFFNFFKECISGLSDFQGISGLAISGLENFENSGLAFSGFKKILAD